MKFKRLKSTLGNFSTIAISLALGLMVTNCRGQSKTSSTTYTIMLNALLKHSVAEMEVEQWLAEQSKDQYVVLDSRSKNEFEVSHIKDAVYVGYDDFDTSTVAHLNRSDTVLVYCSVGYRSEKIAERLEEMGFKNVHNLYGGIFEWVNQGGKVYDESGAPTSKIHGYDKKWARWLKAGEIVLD